MARNYKVGIHGKVIEDRHVYSRGCKMRFGEMVENSKLMRNYREKSDRGTGREIEEI